METLEEIREKIDEVDERMAELFARRIELAKEAAEVKRGSGLPAEDPEREAQILEKHGKRFANNPQLRDDYELFQKTVIAISKHNQK